jgi:hypothetical protein
VLMFIHPRPSLISFLFNNKRNVLRPAARVLHITDAEGDVDFFIKSIRQSCMVNYNPDRGLSFARGAYGSAIPHLIFGGDATDRNTGDLAIIEMLLQFKKEYPDQIHLLVGNREITKMRLQSELAPDSIRQRLMYTSSPRWLPNQPTVPLDYVKARLEKNHLPTDMSFIHSYINSLSTKDCQLIYLHWMLEKTMGCPHTFRYRREELIRKYARDVTDKEVLNNFIKESSPDGLTGQYLQRAKLAVLIPNTGILAMHGGMTEENVGCIPEGKERFSNAQRWVDELNRWYDAQVSNWVGQAKKPIVANQPFIPANSALDEAALPIPNKSKSIITATMFNDSQFSIGPAVDKFLADNGIHVVLTGHQPCGDFPRIRRHENTILVNGDTGRAKSDPANPDDTRGHASHALEISASKKGAKIEINATLPDGAAIYNKLMAPLGEGMGDKFIGSVTRGNEIVQCRLPNGHYRLAHQDGFKFTYREVMAAELASVQKSFRL